MTDNLPQRTTPEAAEVTVQDMIRDGWGAIAASLPKTVDDKRSPGSCSTLSGSTPT